MTPGPMTLGPMTLAPMTLAQLLSPLPVADFFTRHGERHAILLRGDPDRFEGWLDVPRLAAYACDRAQLSHLDVLSNGLARPCETPPCQQPKALLDTLAGRGDSLRFRRIQCIDAPLRGLALDAMEALGEEININVYLSPGEARYGLAPHRDPYEVLVVQLSGQKHWRLLGPEQGEAIDWQPATADTPAHGNRGELVCRQGDVLYLPGYVRHQVTTMGDAPSLHLALGILRQTRRSLLEWLRSQLERTSQPEISQLEGVKPIEGAGHQKGAVHLKGAGAGEPITMDQLPSALAEMTHRSQALLADPQTMQRYLEHRRAVCYERTLASPEAYAAGIARGYR